MISTVVSRVSAIVLGIGGLALLFSSDAILPRIIPGFPPDGAWFGQLLAAAWIGVATLNWNSRGAVLGGIYGRPVVTAHLSLYFIGALTLLKVSSANPVLWFGAVPMVLLGATYGALLLRGPFENAAPR